MNDRDGPDDGAVDGAPDDGNEDGDGPGDVEPAGGDAPGVASGDDPRPEADGWEFSLEDIERREAEAEQAAAAAERRTEPIEAGSPSLENAAFVVLGVLLALFVVSRLVVA